MLSCLIMELNDILKLRQFNYLSLEVNAREVLLRGELQEAGKACPDCGNEETKPHQYYEKKVRHLSILNQPTYLCFVHTLQRCLSCGRCFMEKLDFMRSQRQYTRQYEQHIYELCRGQSISRVAEMERLSRDEVKGILKKGRNRAPENASPKRYDLLTYR